MVSCMAVNSVVNGSELLCFFSANYVRVGSLWCLIVVVVVNKDNHSI